MSETDSLTAEDLRSRLYHSLRDKGLVDALKTQLRNRLVTELKQVGVSQNFKPEPVHGEGGSLLQKAADSLVADHLRRCHYDYSLSVFLPESGGSEDKIFTSRDLLTLLNVSPASRLFRHLSVRNGEHKKGFLWEFLCEIAALHGNSSRESGMQTEAMGIPPTASLHEKFREVDDYYSNLGEESKSGRLAIEERILSYQRQIEERSRTEVQLENARFKETELARMRVEERERCAKELERNRREMDMTYRAKYDALADREKNSIERLQKQTEIGEKETFMQRQSILEEIEIVRQREAELRRTMEINTREKQVLEDRIKTKEESIKFREERVKKSEIEYEQRLHDQIAKFKLEEQSRYLQRYKDLEWREMKVKEDERRLGDELHDIKTVKDELRDKRISCNQLEAEVEKLRRDVLNHKHTSETLSARCREMVDYQVVKDENLILKRDLDQMKERYAECNRDLQLERQKHEQLLLEQTEKGFRPTAEMVRMQRELEKARIKLREEQLLADHFKASAEARIHEQVDRGRSMMHHFEEQNLHQNVMNKEMRDLRGQLSSTRYALTNEVYRNRSPEFAAQSLPLPRMPTGIYPAAEHKCKQHNLPFHKHSMTGLSTSPSLCDLEFDADVDPLPAEPHPEPVNTNSNNDLLFSRNDDDTTGGNTQSSDYSYSMDLVAETKSRLKGLEREAENLRQNYLNFQHRMTNTTTLLPEPAMVVTQLSRTPSGRTSTTPHRSHASSTHRPLSSTPYKSQVTGGQNEMVTPPRPTQTRTQRSADDRPRMNLSMSTVGSEPSTPEKKQDQNGRKTGMMENRMLTLDDLEARPGSPSVVVLEATAHSSDDQIDKGDRKDSRHAPAGKEVSEKSDAPVVSLDNAWKQDEETRRRESEERRRRQIEEDREFEEEQRRRQEERKRKEEERWQREQEELRRLQTGGHSEGVFERKDTELTPRKDVTPPKEEKPSEPAIDPVMQKYMEMVAKSKQEKEKEATQVKSDPSKNQRERTHSQTTENDVSEGDKSGGGAGGFGSDDDFDW